MGFKTYSCPVSKRCGGCQWLNVPYPIQLKRKQDAVEELLGGYCKVNEIIGMDAPQHYRHKILAPFAPGPKGRILYGLYAQNSHRIVQSDSCLIEDERAKRILATIHSLMASFKIKPYDEDARRGFLRHVLIRTAYATDEVMVTFVCAGKIFPSKNTFVKVLRSKHPEITTIVMNINTRDTNVVLGTQENVLFGKGWIEDKLCGCTFRISSGSFYQVNPEQAEKLYNAAIDMARLSGEETILDAYCGTGTIGIIASKRAKRLIGVESNEDAVRDAKTNARRNNVENAEFFAQDASVFMNALAQEGSYVDVVFMDPPRGGSDEKFLRSLAHLGPRRIVYISCNPKTQQRDVAFLLENGYRVDEIQPVDMFPHTEHIECVVAMSRTNK